ncbi:MAG: hypothetical protein WCF84_10510 [Anaerolineae bacterium]
MITFVLQVAALAMIVRLLPPVQKLATQKIYDPADTPQVRK